MITGSISSSDLQRVGRLVQGLPGEMRREVVRSLRAPAERVADEQRREIRALRGSPAPSEWIEEGQRDVQVVVQLSGARVGAFVQLRRTQTSWGPWLLNKGQWTHPVFGRSPMVSQSVRPGWFDRPAGNGTPRIRTAAEDALQEATEDFARRVDDAGRI